MAILACGGRTGVKTRAAYKALDAILEKIGDDHTVIEGDAPGYDRVAAAWTRWRRLPLETMRIEEVLDGYDTDAPKRRNARMLARLLEFEERYVVGFPGASGTRNMMHTAHTAGARVLDVEFEDGRFRVWEWPQVKGETARLIAEGSY